MAALPPTDLELFNRRALAFLRENAEPRACNAQWGVGSDALAATGTQGDEEQERAELKAAQSWRQLVFDSGFGWIGGPREYGGGGADPRLDAVYEALEAKFVVPNQTPIRTAVHTVAPALLAFGDDQLKRRYLRAIHRGEVQTCQLLSEPDAGSDLASLRTTAVREGDAWIVTGQKVWSSFAHLADIGQLLARTDADSPKHRGLTMFVVSMDAPGVEVRPLRQITGEAHFNEVFLNSVRIPDRDRVGDPGSGWSAVQATFATERSGIGSGVAGDAEGQLARLLALYRHYGDQRDPALRRLVVDAWSHHRLLSLLGSRLEALQSTGRLTGVEGSLLKVERTRQMGRLASAAEAILGPALVADTGHWGTYCWSEWVCGIPGWRIAGGTDEIQRNILAERLLRLPREPTPQSR